MRMGFIRKVYGILTVQLLLTVMIGCFGFIDSYKIFIKDHFFLMYIALGVLIITLIPLSCCRETAREVPTNYILLFIFTITEGFIISALIAGTNNWRIVVIAASLTFLVTAALTAYACTAKTDFTFLGGVMFVGIILMIFITLFSILFGTFLHTFYCALGVIVYSIYLIYNTQLIMGKVGAGFSIDDYVFAALTIYLDVVQIFLYILSLLGGGSKK